MAGTARIAFTVEALGMLNLVPSTYRLIGSDKSDQEGVVVLLFTSGEIAEGKTFEMTMDVVDIGSTRTARMRPIAQDLGYSIDPAHVLRPTNHTRWYVP